MAQTMTLLQLRTAVRQQADMVNSQFVSDAELNGYINQSIYELWDLLIENDQDFGVTSTTFTIATGNTQSLPADFYKFKGLDDLTSDSNSPLTVRKFSFNERNSYSLSGLPFYRGAFSDVYYRVVGSSLLFEPPERAPGTYKLWYIVVPTALALDADTFDGVNGWHQYIIYDSSIKCLVKEESSTTVLEKLKEEQKLRIMKASSTRDNAQGEKVTRIARNPRSRLVTGRIL